jgi:hypothetical protein
MIPGGSGTKPANSRQARLAASLRENLKRRKMQQRSRGGDTAKTITADTTRKAEAQDGSGE